jgi:hypothetical protein
LVVSASWDCGRGPCRDDLADDWIAPVQATVSGSPRPSHSSVSIWWALDRVSFSASFV